MNCIQQFWQHSAYLFQCRVKTDGKLLLFIVLQQKAEELRDSEKNCVSRAKMQSSELITAVSVAFRYLLQCLCSLSSRGILTGQSCLAAGQIFSCSYSPGCSRPKMCLTQLVPQKPTLNYSFLINQPIKQCAKFGKQKHTLYY